MDIIEVVAGILFGIAIVQDILYARKDRWFHMVKMALYITGYVLLMYLYYATK